MAVEPLSEALEALSARVARLERGERCGGGSSPVGQSVEDLVRLLQAQFHQQQGEFKELRERHEQLQAAVSSGVPRKRRDSEQAHQEQLKVLQSGPPLQLKELRLLQQEKQANLQDSADLNASYGDGLQDPVQILKELREERGVIAEMLGNVRQEKCEVIAAMHSFAIDKNEALSELEGLRRDAADEITGLMARGPVAAAPQQVVAHEAWPPQVEVATVATMQHMEQQQRHFEAAHVVRQVSAQMPQAHMMQQQVLLQQSPHMQQPGQRQSSRPSLAMTAAAAAAAGTVQPSSTAPHVQRAGQIAGTAQQVEMARRCAGSPSRQQSAVLPMGAGNGRLPVSIMCSPTVVTRSTTGDVRTVADVRSAVQVAAAGAPQHADARRSPVRRFISAGISPRLDAQHLPGAHWPTQVSLARS